MEDEAGVGADEADEAKETGMSMWGWMLGYAEGGVGREVGRREEGGDDPTTYLTTLTPLPTTS